MLFFLLIAQFILTNARSYQNQYGAGIGVGSQYQQSDSDNVLDNGFGANGFGANGYGPRHGQMIVSNGNGVNFGSGHSITTTQNGMVLVKTPMGKCVFMNGKVYENGVERPATQREIEMVEQYERDWQQWGREFGHRMNDHMSNMFPPGFPFNSHSQTAPSQMTPPPAPELPCFCRSC